MAKIKTTVEDRKNRGLCIGNTGLGKTKVKRDGFFYIELDSREDEKLKLIRSWRIEGLTYQDIVDRCKERGIVTRHGRPPKLSTVGTWVRATGP